MNNEERIEQAETQRALMVPYTAIADEMVPNLSLSIRGYDALEPVNLHALAKAKEMVDDENTIIAPIGGIVQLGNSEYGSGFLVDDLAPIKTMNAGVHHVSTVNHDQIPIMIDEQPAERHDGEKEFDFGRIPAYIDYKSSVLGQAKPEEQVLSVPAWQFIKYMLLNEDSAYPAEVNHHLYTNLAFLRRAWCEKDTRFIQLLPYIFFWKLVGDEIHIFVYQRGKGVGEGRLAGGCSIGVGGHVNPLDFLSTQTKLSKISTPSGPDVHSIRTSRMLCEGFWTGILNNFLREGGEEIAIEMNTEEGMVPMDLTNFISGEAAKEGKTMERWLYDRTTFFLDYAASDVEKVHLAMMIGVQVPENFELRTNEEELLDVGFTKLTDLYVDDINKTLPTRLECWSRSIVDSIYETIQFTEQNKAKDWFINSQMVRESMRSEGTHPINPEAIASIPKEDRWKIGTIAGSFNEAYRFYSMNAYVRV
jgi:predicted NUDIX family phosphoesterase